MAFVAIRLATGTLTQSEITSNDAYLIENFPRQSDMPNNLFWMATTAEPVKDAALETSLSGKGIFYGKAKGKIKLFGMTPGMWNYLWVNIFRESPRQDVTVQVAHQRMGATVYNCQIKWPFADDYGGEWRSENFQTNTIIEFDQGIVSAYGRSFSSAFSSAFGNGGGTTGAFSLAFSSAFAGDAPAHGSYDSAFSTAFDK